MPEAYKTTVEINFKAKDDAEALKVKAALVALGNNLTAENLIFLGGLSTKNSVNEKLKSKHTLIKTFL